MVERSNYHCHFFLSRDISCLPETGPPKLHINESVYLVDPSSEYIRNDFRLVDAWYERLAQTRGE